MRRKLLVSAGEASGDRYAAGLALALAERLDGVDLFGCAGREMRAAGVEPVISAESLSVVGLAEVVSHLPGIYGKFRKLVAEAERRKPDLAILTDSPDFHLRLAPKLRKLGIPVVYLVAPQAWAWREGRVKKMRSLIEQLHCIFPFEESWYRERGVNATYIGHPLARVVRPKWSKAEFLARHRIPPDRPVITLCPGSRGGEIARHLPLLLQAVNHFQARRAATFLLALPQDGRLKIRMDEACEGHWHVIEGETWDALAHCDAAMVASGTVTIEAGLLGTPMVSYYRVSPATWALGRRFVRVPHLTMVNLVAERRIVPELMQQDATGSNLAEETLAILDHPERRRQMREDLAQVRRILETDHDPLAYSAGLIASRWETK